LCGLRLLRGLALDNLRKRRVIVVHWCCMYKKSWESINHFLLHWEVARELWVAIRFFGLEWIMPRKVIEVLERSSRKAEHIRSLEDGSIVLNVVYLERAKR
jgi:hypothetical protein